MDKVHVVKLHQPDYDYDVDGQRSRVPVRYSPVYIPLDKITVVQESAYRGSGAWVGIMGGGNIQVSESVEEVLAKMGATHK